MRHLIAVTCERSGHEALYLNGEMVGQDSTIYAADIARYVGEKPIRFLHVLVLMPDSETSFPKYFEECLLWMAEENPNSFDQTYVWNPVATMPKDGRFLIGVWEGEVRKPRIRFRVYEAKGFPTGPVWGTFYRSAEGDVYEIVGWMAKPSPPGDANTSTKGPTQND